MKLKVCVVGAGFAGLTTARVFCALGHEVVLYEKESDVGGVWSSSRRYPGLTTQNPKRTYELSEFPMPDEYPEWPTGEQVQVYMQAYVDHFHLNDVIRLNTEVVHASLNADGPRWTVETRTTQKDGSTIDHTEHFDYLVIGNGIFSIPAIPEYPGADEFVAAGGRLCHTSEFTNLEDARDKHVLIVGYGKSSCDVAMSISSAAASTTVVARNLIWKLPKLIGGKLNYKHLFLTRLSEALFRYVRLRGMDRFFHTWGNPVRKSMLNTVEWIIERQLHLRQLGLHPGKPLETIARSTVSLVTDGFYEAVGDGTIKLYREAEIASLTEGRAILSDGTSLPADIIICGTGWHQRCSFLDDELMRKVTDAQGNFRLYQSMIPVGVPGLAFNGYNSSFFSQLNCEIGALWLAHYLHGGIELPSEEVQNRQIDERLAWMEKRTDGKHSKGTNIIPFSIHHIDELLNDMDMNVGRFTQFKQWFGALKPEVYGHILAEVKEAHRHSTAEVRHR